MMALGSFFRRPAGRWLLVSLLCGCGPAPRPTVGQAERPRPPVGVGEAAAADPSVLEQDAHAAALAGDCRRVDDAMARLEEQSRPIDTPALALTRGRCTPGGARLAVLAPALTADETHDEALKVADEVVPALSEAELIRGAADAATADLAVALRVALIERPDAAPEAVAAALAALPEDHPLAAAARARSRRVRVGLILPLTGRSHRIGNQLNDLVGMLGGEDDPDGGATLVVRDGGSPAAAQAALESFLADKVDGVVGLFDRASATATAEVASHSPIPIIMLTLSDAPLRVDGPVWRALDTPSMVARTAAGALLGRGARTVAIVYPDNAYGQTMADWFGRAWEAGGGEVVEQIDWDRDAGDFGAVAKRIARTPADALFMPSDPTSGAQLLTHLAAVGVWPLGDKPRFAGEKDVRELLMIGTPQWYAPQFLQQAGRYANFAMLTVPFAAETARGARFATRVRQALDREPDAFDAFLADSVKALVRAHANQRRDGGRLVDALRAAVVDDGATSGLQFKARDAVPALFVLDVRDGAFRPR